MAVENIIMDESSTSSNARKRKRSDNEEPPPGDQCSSATGDPNERKSPHHHEGDDEAASKHYESESSISDDESDDEEEAGNSSYSEDQEKLPKCAAFDERTVALPDRIRHVTKDAAQIFDIHACKTQETERLRGKSNEICEIPVHDPKIIAFIGRGGQGKSSTVNSIIDRPGLADAGNGVNSVTCVPTIYETAPEEQIPEFQLRSNTSTLQRSASFLLYQQEPCDLVEQNEKYARQRTAVSVFAAAFRHRKDFSTDDETAKTLCKICKANGTYQEKVQEFVEIVEAAMDHRISGSKRQVSEEHQTLEKLHEWLNSRIGIEESRVPKDLSLSPFVKQATIGVRGSKVLECWRIADLPGLDDIHKNLLATYGPSFKDKFDIVVTKCDDGLEVKRMKSYAQHEPELKSGCEDWALFLDLLDNRKQYLKKRSSKDANARQKLDSLQAARPRCNSLFTAKAVEFRNKDAIAKAQPLIERYVPGVEPRMFCISNMQYEAHKDSSLDVEARISVKLTGVPALRSQLLSLAGPDKFKKLQDFVDFPFTDWIASCKLWLHNTSDERDDDLVLMNQESKPKVAHMFGELEDNLKHEAARPILSHLKASGPEYAAYAAEIVDHDLRKQHWPTLGAFFRRSGTYRDRPSWNLRFTTGARSFVNSEWEPLTKSATKQLGEVKGAATAMAESMKPHGQAKKAFAGGPVNTMDDTLQGKINGIRQAFEQAEAKLAEDLKVTRINVAEGNFFTKAMKPAYEECNSLTRGLTIRKRSLDVLQAHLTKEGDSSPFALFVDRIERAIQNSVKTTIANLQKQTLLIFQEIEKDDESTLQGYRLHPDEEHLRNDLVDFFEKWDTEIEEIKRACTEIEKGGRRTQLIRELESLTS
ncbi:hypothetical protein M409DRAFT_28587 [Zasmidium cellare ATCC 36951]|uniref:DUF7605 domain-containing protein n=1 Tax=Zasmidium cellare ATCC 36951 TaxID=1080233 RepID=A0A6A6C1U4_ZASCE|nr:uncharacterized protein M409DRAFT_28587 [Zasmidium cellare ATCC 36951]KAF2160981.1 hypothetical protein M409DRAFT_28587 [Zasmidium cellare ATCC 36951]